MRRSDVIVCVMDGCERPVHGRGLCGTHHRRLTRTGTPTKTPPKYLYGTNRGYVEARVSPSHPLAAGKRLDGGSRVRVLAHRVALFDKIGAGPHPCHWCGCSLSWDVEPKMEGALTVDHLDWDRANNAPGNLVASCLACNVKRLRKRQEDGRGAS